LAKDRRLAGVGRRWVAGADRNDVIRPDVVTPRRAWGPAATRQAAGLSPAPVCPWPPGKPDRGLAAALPKGMAPVADPQHLPAVVIALPAEIDMANAGRTGQQLRAALAPGVAAVIADMTATRFCDSSGISMLVQAHGQAAANGTELRLVVASAAVLRTLTLTGLDQLLPIYPSLSQALAAGPAPRPETHHE
jgi:anti-sigma B factor antagonist